MAEIAFLNAVESFLRDAGLSPAPVGIGVAEPTLAAELPALVLSLEDTERKAAGIGERVATVEGALAWQATIALDDPVLPEEPTFHLLSPDRRELILPHGGLVRGDGTSGALTADDLRVQVRDLERPVVTGAPTGNQVRCDASSGTLFFATALPQTGNVQADYFVGRWERRIARLQGTLRIDLCAAAAGDVRVLSEAVLAALGAPAARSNIDGLLSLEVSGLGSIGAVESAATGGGRRRALRFLFQFEQRIDRPDSSGGIIQRVQTVTHLPVAEVGVDGTIFESLVTEVD